MPTHRFPFIALAILCSIRIPGCTLPTNESSGTAINPAAGLRDADSDGDGSVSRAEFEAQAHARFDDLDADQSDSLSPEEFQAAFDAAIRRLPWALRGRARDRANPERSFADRDVNGDGVIAREESLEHASRTFDRFDQDSDGLVAPDEAEAVREEARDAMRSGRR